MEDIEKLRYPVGRFAVPESFTQSELNKWISEIQNLPSLLRKELADFSGEMYSEQYRENGWTARQVVNHIADSHMNGFIRFKLTLTEDLPTIRPYFEDRWAKLPDANCPPEISVEILEALHKRWVFVIKNMNAEDFERKYYHPESKKEFSLKTAIAMYAWHGWHHLEHVRIVKRKFTAVNS